MTTTNDAVNHPSHYNSHPEGIESILITKHETFTSGNALKYILRHGLKSEGSRSLVSTAIQDIDKAIWYLQQYREDLSKFGLDALPGWRRREALGVLQEQSAAGVQGASSVSYTADLNPENEEG